MGSIYRGDVDNLKNHILTLRVVVVMLLIIIAGLWVTSENAKKTQRIFVPPDLTQSSVVTVNTANKPTVYGFAINIFQYLNTWLNDGNTDYRERAIELSSYLTPTYIEWLKKDLLKRKVAGELQGRTRTITLVNGKAFDDRRVEKISPNRYVVWLDFQIHEYQKGMEVKEIKIRYPLRVVTANIGVDFNPWGLQLDGYSGNPEILQNKDLQ